MISVAVMFDLIQFLVNLLHFIPGIGNTVAFVATSIITVIAGATFYLWFRFNGVKFTTPKRALSFGGGFLLEFIPILNALPAWTLAVILVIGTTRLPKVIQDAAGVAGIAKNKS